MSDKKSPLVLAAFVSAEVAPLLQVALFRNGENFSGSRLIGLTVLYSGYLRSLSLYGSFRTEMILPAKQAKSSISSSERRDCDHRVLHAVSSARKGEAKKERKEEGEM